MGRACPVFKSPFDDLAHISIRQLKNGAAPDIHGELLQLREAGSRKAIRQRPRGVTKIASEALCKSFQEAGSLRPRWRIQLGTDLEAPPCRSIQQLVMIRCTNQDDMWREPIYLEQKCGDNALDLPGLMFVSALFSDSVELIEEGGRIGGVRTNSKGMIQT